MNATQEQIVRLRSQGKQLKEIGDLLVPRRSKKTVEFHWHKLGEEFGTHDPVEIVRKFNREELRKRKKVNEARARARQADLDVMVDAALDTVHRAKVRRNIALFIGMLVGMRWTPVEISNRFNIHATTVNQLAGWVRRKYNSTVNKKNPAENAALVRLALRCGATIALALMMAGCATPAHAPVTPPPPPPKVVFDPGTQAHALVKPVKPNTSLTTVTMAWNPYTDTTANSLLLTWEGGSAIVPRTATSYHITNLKVNSLYHFNLCGTNTAYLQPLIAGQCCSTNWTAINWSTSASAPVP